VVQLGWEFSLVIYPGSTPVGNATLVVANVLTCNKYSQKYMALLVCLHSRLATFVHERVRKWHGKDRI
jgi:hypothetical protein